MTEEMCTPDENVLRAVHHHSFDAELVEVSSDAFYSRNNPISVNRLVVLPIADIARITKRDLGDKYVALAEINVGNAIDAGREVKQEISVVPRPVLEPNKENPSHAEIVGNITKGIAKRLAKLCKNIYSMECQILKS